MKSRADEPAGPGSRALLDDADENTPLLVSDPEISEATTLNNEQLDGNADENANDEDDKPLPVAQIAVLCYARWVEPVAYFSIFPYINKMTKENGNLADTDIGFYSGLIESLFSLTQMVVMIFWGLASDRFGRKPVLVMSLLGVSLATAMFGTAKTIWQMILYRCLAGVFAGSLVTIRTMISEHSTAKTHARAFSWFAFTGNLGILFGPLIGGALAEPATQYSWFRNVDFFIKYPYALSSFAVSVIGLTAVAATALLVEETLKRDKGAADDETFASKPRKISMWELISSPGVGTVIYAYAHIMLLAFAYTSVVPLFWSTPVHLGGLGFSPLEISLLMGLNGFAQAAWLLLVFAPLQHRIGTNGVLRVCSTFYPLFMCLSPLFNMLLRSEGDTGRTVFWAVGPVTLAIGCGVAMSFTAIQLALNDVSPNPMVLGTLNSLALSIVSGVRAFSPALFNSLFAMGARSQWLYGHAIWVLMTALALGFTVLSRYMPDYDELRRQREERERASASQVYVDDPLLSAAERAVMPIASE